MFRSKQIIIRE